MRTWPKVSEEKIQSGTSSWTSRLWVVRARVGDEYVCDDVV